jgi:UDP-N-acetyl-D-mannosaminuronic acid transferase (WecB/TagA/CpsF family)
MNWTNHFFASRHVWGRKKGYRHFFYGGAEGVAERLVENLSNHTNFIY